MQYYISHHNFLLTQNMTCLNCANIINNISFASRNVVKLLILFHRYILSACGVKNAIYLTTQLASECDVDVVLIRSIRYSFQKWWRVLVFWFTSCILHVQGMNDLVTELEQSNISCKAAITFSEGEIRSQLLALKVSIYSYWMVGNRAVRVSLSAVRPWHYAVIGN